MVHASGQAVVRCVAGTCRQPRTPRAVPGYHAQRDTPDRAQAFLSKQRALGRIDFVLGSRSDLRPVWDGFFVQPQSATHDHDARLTLVDAKGFQRVGYPGAEATPERLAHDLRILEREAAG